MCCAVSNFSQKRIHINALAAVRRRAIRPNTERNRRGRGGPTAPASARSSAARTSDGKIDSNRLTLPNRNEQFRFSTAAQLNALAFSYTSITVKIASRLTFASMSPVASAKAITCSSSVAMRQGRSDGGIWVYIPQNQSKYTFYGVK